MVGFRVISYDFICLFCGKVISCLAFCLLHLDGFFSMVTMATVQGEL